MHKLKHNPIKKMAAAMSIAIIGVALSFQQNVFENLLSIKTAKAEVFGAHESDILQTDLTGPSCSPNDNQNSSDVATNDDRTYIFVWQDDACSGGNGTGIYLQKYDSLNGPDNPSSGPQTVNDGAGDQKDPSIAMDHEGNYVVAWDGNGSGDTDGIYIQAFKSNGTAVGSPVLVNSHTSGIQSNPKVAMDFDTNISQGETGHFVVTWQGEGSGDTDGIYMQRFDSNFTSSVSPVGSNIQVNTFTAGAQVDPDVAMNNFDEVIVTWSGPGTGFPSSNEIWIQGYDSNNQPWGGTQNNIRINSTTPSSKPAIAADKSSEPSNNSVPGGKFVIVYKAGSDIYGKLIDRCTSSGCPLGNVELNISTTTSDNPDVAMDYLGNFTATWEQDDGSGGGNVNIHAINYDYLGHRIDNNFKVNENIYSDDSANQTNAHIAKDKDGEYYITWTSQGNATNKDVRYRAFGTDIFKHGQETLANTPTLSGFNEAEVSTAMAPNGNHAIAYIGLDNSTHQRIFYSLYDNQGNAIVQNQIADTINDSSVSNPSISFFKDTQGTGVGRFVIVWTGHDPANNEGTSQQIMYREFDAAGQPTMNAENPVNTFVSSATYNDAEVSAGYYNNSSASTIDRFAVIFNETESDPDFPGTNFTNVTAAYHTQTGFTSAVIHQCQQGVNSCNITSDSRGVDLYPDIDGNDKIIYTWDEFTIPGSTNYAIYGREANGGTLAGSNFTFATSVGTQILQPDVAFVSPTQYVASWTACNSLACLNPGIVAARYVGDFSGGAPSPMDSNIQVYPGTSDNSSDTSPRISGDTSNGSFVITWMKAISINSGSYQEIDGKFFETSPNLSNFGIGFVVNSTQNGNQIVPDVSMNNNGQAIVGWEGGYNSQTGTLVDNYGAVLQVLNNPTFVQTLPELPTSAELNIVQGGKTLTIPSTIQFPNITASSMNPTDVEREVDENPATGQPLYFQMEDAGGNPTNCTSGPCYSVTISSSNFTYTDPNTGQTYTIPASDVFLKNYDGNHPGVAGTGTCGTPGAALSFNTLFGNTADFSLDSTTCDYTPLDTNQTMLNKISNTSDTGKIQWYPKLKITVPALTPPGTYTGTITITSA